MAVSKATAAMGPLGDPLPISLLLLCSATVLCELSTVRLDHSARTPRANSDPSKPPSGSWEFNSQLSKLRLREAHRPVMAPSRRGGQSPLMSSHTTWHLPWASLCWGDRMEAGAQEENEPILPYAMIDSGQ